MGLPASGVKDSRTSGVPTHREFWNPSGTAAQPVSLALRAAILTGRLGGMSTRENPFPGMNPFFQNRWLDAHTSLIGYVRDALNGELPEELTAQAEEGIRVAGASGILRAEVAVVESWKEGFPPVWQPHSPGAQVALEVTEPYLIEHDRPMRWVEIRSLSGDLVTTIEIISPWNKRDGCAAYVAKRGLCVDGGVNVVEIDLTRGGDPLTLIPGPWRQEWIDQGHRMDYEVAVWRACANRIEAYPVSLRERLPTLRIPLRITDPDVPLALQPVVDRCHVNGRYWQLTDLGKLHPPLAEEDRRWADDRLREAGLAGGTF